MVPKVRAQAPACPVLLLTGHHQPEHANRAQLLHAQFAYKPRHADNVIGFAAGALTRPSGEYSVTRPDPVAAFSAAHGLAPRQRQVLEGLVANQTREEIAVALGISEVTLKNHVHGLLERCKESSVDELARRLRRAR